MKIMLVCLSSFIQASLLFCSNHPPVCYSNENMSR